MPSPSRTGAGPTGGTATATSRKIEVITGSEDGIKVGEAVTDITIDKAWIFCYDIEPTAHQDAFQAIGGHDLSIKLISRCRTSNHSSFFVNAGVGPNPPPREIVCHDCELKGGSTTVHTTERRSGVIDSDIYCGKFFCFDGEGEPGVIFRRNTQIPYGKWEFEECSDGLDNDAGRQGRLGRARPGRSRLPRFRRRGLRLSLRRI